jgi:hypothetical protein
MMLLRRETDSNVRGWVEVLVVERGEGAGKGG